MIPIKKTTLSRQLNADGQPFDEFQRRAVAAAAKHPEAIHADMPLDLCEWLDDADEGVEELGLKSAHDLEAESKGVVRVM